MKEPLFDPAVSGAAMNIACFISGSGTNYRAIVSQNPDHNYTVFTNRPDCEGLAIAAEYGHKVVKLSHVPYLREARRKYGPGRVPPNCPERLAFEEEAVRLIEESIGGKPDLVCLAGYDQLLTDRTIFRYYPRMINVHPGDTTRGYDGLHWIPSAKAILAGEESLRSTLFIVDNGLDTGPVLLLSRPLDIAGALRDTELAGKLEDIKSYAAERGIKTYAEFREAAGEERQADMKEICLFLQNALKEAGDWEVYPAAVKWIAEGRVEIDGRTLFLDGKELPEHGYRLG